VSRAWDRLDLRVRDVALHVRERLGDVGEDLVVAAVQPSTGICTSGSSRAMSAKPSGCSPKPACASARRSSSLVNGAVIPSSASPDSASGR
jgi:hypothetical protein